MVQGTMNYSQDVLTSPEQILCNNGIMHELYKVKEIKLNIRRTIECKLS